MSNVNKAVSTNSIIKMWVLLEGDSSSVKYNILPNDYITKPDLGDLKLNPISKIKALKDVEPGKLEIFSYEDRINPLRQSTSLESIVGKITDINPLVIRYPLSSSTVILRCNLSNSSVKIIRPHTSGLWYLVRSAIEKKFEELRSSSTQYIFVSNNGTKDQMLIDCEYAFNDIITDVRPNEANKRIIHLSINIPGKKSYFEWKFKDVFRDILKQDHIALDTVPRFNPDELPPVKPPIIDDELDLFIKSLSQKYYTFRNEIKTSREFISIFMNTAVRYVQLHINENAWISVESELNGSRGYGYVDYVVNINGNMVLIEEAKWKDTAEDIAQVLMQMHTVVEKIGKRKCDSDQIPQIFGIVTTGRNWRFIRWIGQLESPMVEISEEYICGFKRDDNSSKNVIECILRILQEQATFSNNNEDERDAKRPCNAHGNN
ncbi:9587_t:CDS:2, partial [Funneliformis geosporum]